MNTPVYVRHVVPRPADGSPSVRVISAAPESADSPTPDGEPATPPRTLAGLAVPWDVPAPWWEGTIAYAAGSVTPPESGRVRLLLDHDSSRPVGRVLELESTDQGLRMTARVSNTRDGDEALVLAEDGVRDELSVGVWLHEWTDNDAGDRVVTRAEVDEISLVTFGRYGSAGTVVDTVTNRIEDRPMTPPQLVPAVATGHDAAAAARLEGAPEIMPQGAPAYDQAARIVSEPEPYTEESARRGVSWVGDMLAAHAGNRDAFERLERLNRANNAVDAGWFVPGYLAARYVTPHIDQAVMLGLLTGIPITDNSFEIPVVNNVPDVADYAEGGTVVQTEPDTDVVAVTVDALAGEVVLNQRAIDFATPALDVIVSNQIGRNFRTKADKKIVAKLGASTVPSVTLATNDYAGIRAAVEKAKTDVFDGTDGYTANGILTDSANWMTLRMADDTTKRPMISDYGQPVNTSLSAPNPNAQVGLVGYAFGLPVYRVPGLVGMAVGAWDAFYGGLLGPRMRTMTERESRQMKTVIQAYGYVTSTFNHDPKAAVKIANAAGTLAAKG